MIACAETNSVNKHCIRSDKSRASSTPSHPDRQLARIVIQLPHVYGPILAAGYKFQNVWSPGDTVDTTKETRNDSPVSPSLVQRATPDPN
jgi:hypothetical protein